MAPSSRRCDSFGLGALYGPAAQSPQVAGTSTVCGSDVWKVEF